jgi:hypothetical protein
MPTAHGVGGAAATSFCFATENASLIRPDVLVVTLSPEVFLSVRRALRPVGEARGASGLKTQS